MQTLYIDNFSQLKTKDWAAIFGREAIIQPIDEQTVAIIRAGEIQAHLICLSGKYEPTPLDRLDLTTRQQAVFELLVTGLSNREIAERLGVHERTIAKHISTIFVKTGCHKRREVIKWYLKPGPNQANTEHFMAENLPWQ
jgi:DNA-binding NarL/FixJ family response regulator